MLFNVFKKIINWYQNIIWNSSSIKTVVFPFKKNKFALPKQQSNSVVWTTSFRKKKKITDLEIRVKVPRLIESIIYNQVYQLFTSLR